jgi:CIC family chloride channel protein
MKNLLLDKIKIILRFYYLKSSRKAGKWYEKAKMTEHFYMILMAILIGIAAGFGAVIIRELVHFISRLCFGNGKTILEGIANTPWYYVMLIPFIGGLIVGPITHFVAPEAKGHGVPEVMKAILLRGGVIRPIVAFVKSITSAITIGTGGAVGNEGPIVQIGATIGSSIGQFFRMPSKRMKILVGCGSAAGIAAAFNVPVAGALFTIEVILLDFTITSFSPIIISAGIATAISRYFVGDFAEFQVPPVMMQSNYEIFFFFILGLLCGLVSYLMIKALYFFEDFFDEKIKIPVYLKPAIGGLCVGLIGILFPQIMGVGNDTIDIAINTGLLWYIAFALVFIKILATSLTLGSGGSGGVLSPALFIGAMLGAFYGYVLNQLLPGQVAIPGAYALVAMGGLIAGIVRAPLTAIIIVFELTKQTTAIIPLMIVSTISLLLSQKLSRESIYTLGLVLSNINLKHNAETGVFKNILVKDVYSKEYVSIQENARFEEVVKTIISKNLPCISVHSKEGKFKGFISLHTIKDIMFDKDILNNLIISGDIASCNVPITHLNEDAYNTLEKMTHFNFDGLPVMDDKNPDKQIGMIWQNDLHDAIHKEVEKIEFTTDFAHKIRNINHEQDIHISEHQSIVEIKAPLKFVGRTLAGLRIRNIYEVEVLSIKSIVHGEDNITVIPKPDYEIKSDDYLIIAGETEKVNILKHLD